MRVDRNFERVRKINAERQRRQRRGQIMEDF
jgi:hypothetical protein